MVINGVCHQKVYTLSERSITDAPQSRIKYAMYKADCSGYPRASCDQSRLEAEERERVVLVGAGAG